MASTEQRTGFRFGWGSRGDSEKAAEQAQTSNDAQEPASDSSGSSDVAQAETTAADAATSAETTQQQTPEHQAPAAESANAVEAWPSSDMPEPVSPPVFAPPPASEPRQTGFLADLMRAMQAAAEQNRKQVMERFHEEARGLNDTATNRSAEQVTELRRRADADVDAIREASKAEIARIKAETDERIAARRADLERQLEEHQALVQREAEKIQARVRGFEQQMESFFYRLQSVPDPTTFAAVAQEMPEPPAVDSLAAQARAEAMAESPLAGATPSRSWDAPFATSPEWSAQTTGQTWQQTPVASIPTPASEPSPSAGAWTEPGLVENAPATPEAPAWSSPAPAQSPEQPSQGWGGGGPLSHWQAPAAGWQAPTPSWQPPAPTWQPTTESSAPQAAQTGSWEAQPAVTPESPAYGSESNAWTAPAAPDVTEAQPSNEGQETAEQRIVYGAPAPFVAEALASDADPRLSALAQSPSTDTFSVPAAQSTPETPTVMPGEAFPAQSESTAARLAGLVPSSELPANGRTSEATGPTPTQVVVTGLLSVASIASFKRHLSRIPGVQAVGVSSGPDGEFIFKTSHDSGLALPDAIRALPGFGAEIVSTGEGTINVAAHDPEADA